MILQDPISPESPFRQQKLVNGKSLRDLSAYDGYSCSLRETPEYRFSDLHKVSHLGGGSYSKVSLVITASKDQLAMKSLDPAKLGTQNAFVDAAVDLAREANILSKLDHQNIIRLRGVPCTSLSESFSDAEVSSQSDDGYFILLDTIDETLKSRLSRWRRDLRTSAKGRKKGTISRALSFDAWKKKVSKQASKVDDAKMKDRMRIAAVGVACGMQYLHEEGVIMQDLSVSNVGFDQRTGEVRIFDFGMAHKVNELSNPLQDKREEGLVCGTPRYMAPEVMQGAGGSKESDVFSFGVMLYEICTLQSFFSLDTDLQCFEKHVLSGERPSLDRTVPCMQTRNLISSCWATDPKDRPTFDEIVDVLVTILTADDNDSTLVDENPRALW
ncbi:unnamed protein product [Cylindrotheca closterium]|uniref:Protein kinase domain-containing protein n=1 Tax=Cylindrotheca closterium TaxID=2856 RepID=A0AAD2FNF0_9STRA|nr:unnamed protein product [Cylindrotheca closterium]